MKRSQWLTATMVTMTFVIAVISKIEIPLASQSEDRHSLRERANEKVKILLQPKSCLPYEWEVGNRISLCVFLYSEKDEAFKNIYIATHILLLATKTHENCVEAILNVTESQKATILAAAEIEELWFVALPYHERHEANLIHGADFVTFLKQNPEYQPAGASQWGISGRHHRLEPPTVQELWQFRSNWTDRHPP